MYEQADQVVDIDTVPFDVSQLTSAESVGIVEMGGLGSVLRTTAVSRAVHGISPQAEIRWFTHARGAELLRYVPNVTPVDIDNNLLTASDSAAAVDVLLNFEMSRQAQELARRARCVGGFALNSFGKFGPSSEHATDFQRLQVDDTFRATQGLAMQRIVLGSIGLFNHSAQYDLALPAQKVEQGREVLDSMPPGSNVDRLIGLNIGTSAKRSLKQWPAAHFAALATDLAYRYPDSGVVILSGPEDAATLEEVKNNLGHLPPENISVLGNDLEIGTFMGVIALMDVVVTADTFALHAARAQNVPVVSVVGPMPHQELELSAKDLRIGPQLPCSPCYYRCSRSIVGECMQIIELMKLLQRSPKRLPELIAFGGRQFSPPQNALATLK